MTPCLNWRELEQLIQKMRPNVEGLFLDRLVVPERTAFPAGYLKGEWAMRLTGRKEEGVILFSIRPRRPYLTWKAGKGPKAAPQGTRSPFDLALQKNLKGTKLVQCETLSGERDVILWFSANQKQRLGLVLVLTPAAPEALLISHTVSEEIFAILARSRTIRGEGKAPTHYSRPNGSKAPTDLQIREQLVNPSVFFETVEKELLNEAFSVRLLAAEKSYRALLKQAQDRLRQSETAEREAGLEKDWQTLGDLLKSHLGSVSLAEQTGEPSTLISNAYQVLDYTTGETVSIVKDPKLSLKQQVEKFYHNARRKQRRIQEAQNRIERFRDAIRSFEKKLDHKPVLGDWKALKLWAQQSGASTTPSNSGPSKPQKGSAGAWIGTTFTSKDGMPILVGRNKDENLELTFKHARGNDLWMHVRGKPGSHVVIPLQSGKSAPLETLLDAANLVIFYSGGENWGKTEVDYTFKKYVKRIKDSTEASYTNNKTLLVEMDPVRRKRLLEQNA